MDNAPGQLSSPAKLQEENNSKESPKSSVNAPRKLTSKQKVLLQDYVQSASMHGVGQVFNSEAHCFRRCVWLLLFATAVGYCLAIVVEQMTIYFSYPIGTVEQTKPASSLVFPSVTICNYNRYRRSVITADRVLQVILVTGLQEPKALNWSNPMLAAYANVSFGDVLGEAAHALEETFLECQWDLEKVNCSEVFHTVETGGHICHTFNSPDYIEKNGPYTVNQRGRTKGLTVLLNTQQEEYYYSNNDEDGLSAGFHVIIHGANELPLVEEDSSQLSPGTASNLAMLKTKVTRLPDPYDGGGCLDTNGTDFVNPLEYFSYYTQAGCLQECAYRHTEDACGCVPDMVPVKDIPRPYCNLQKTLDCTIPRLYEYYGLNNRSTACHGCDLPCEEESYDVMPSYAQFPSDVALSRLQAKYNRSAEYIRSNILQLKVFYKVLSYHLSEQKAAYPFGTAMGDIGGLMGICLGASILTLLELVDLCCRLLIKSVIHSKTKTKVYTVA